MTNEQKWAERVAAWRASGLASTEFSAGREFTAGGLRHWAYRLKKLAAVKRLRASARAVPVAPAVRIARVARSRPRAAATPVPVPVSGRSSPTGGMLTVEWGAARILVPAGVDTATVETVLGALARHAARGAR
jgi:hypothetical protein